MGKALNDIGTGDQEVLQSVIEVMETEQLIDSNASIELVPSGSNVLIQMSETKPNKPPSRD